ncbi:hypothetical protein SCAR479_12044 [Seiridium cardinale]|uniref:Uncharacterized protein n=1 Tax=Seiridium cardinale TaxID=138064 RepID=A0ABR2XCI1_9PEZI
MDEDENETDEWKSVECRVRPARPASERVDAQAAESPMAGQDSGVNPHCPPTARSLAIALQLQTSAAVSQPVSRARTE